MGLQVETLGFIPVEDCRLTRRVLRDDALQATFDRLGYVVVPFLSEAEVAALVDTYSRAADSEEGINPPDAYNDEFAEFSIIHSRPQFRREAFETISSVLVPHADELLVDYRPLIANFVNKPPHTGVVPTHQNFSVVDESRYQSVSVWVALVDCVVENGAMSMLDGSHLALRGRRGMWAYQAFGTVDPEVIAAHLTPVEVKAGDAVILDDAVLHYSPPNRTDQRRLAIQFVMLPREADALWFQQIGGEEGSIEAAVLKVEQPYFFDFWHGDGDPAFAERLDTVEIPVPHLDAELFAELLDANAVAPGGTPAAPSGPEPPPARRWLDRLRGRSR